MKPAPVLLLSILILATTAPAAEDPAGPVALVRHAPDLDGGDVEGSLWLLSAEDVSLNGQDAIRGSLFVPGTPSVHMRGRATLGETAEGTGGVEPSGYALRLGGQASLERLVVRTDPREMEEVAPPSAPAGTREVRIDKPEESAGDFATVRDLTVSGGAGAVAVPPGVYGRLAANGRNALVLGVAGSTEPARYEVQELKLAGGAELRLAGPVVITVARRVVVEGRATAGVEDDPRRLSLRVAGEEVSVKGQGTLFAVVQAPAGTVHLGGRARLRGSVACDRLRIGGQSLLQVVVDGFAPPDPENQAPTVEAGEDQSIYLPKAAGLAGSARDDGWPRGSSLTVAWSQVSGPGTVSFADPAAAATAATFSAEGSYVLRLTASDSQLTAADEVAVVVGPLLPPDPATVASAPALGAATSVATSTAFLYTGPDAIQTGVAPGAIQPVRAAVLRGRVVAGGEPLPAVTVRIADHPEWGSTRTREDGRFDLAVNGGGPLLVAYEKEGFLPAERPAEAPWQDYETLPDVTLLALDTRVTEVAVGEAAPAQVAQGSQVTDEDGTRVPTVLFPAGTGAELVLPDGSVRTLETAHVRATEYTVGAGGPAAMPAPLPPNSAYTYAVELSLDEAVAAGAKDVRFSQPVYHYVENFLDFPVGSPVPAGWYDRGKRAWVPSENGRIIKVLGVAGELAEVDLDGDGAADGPEALAALGVTEAERRQLAALYPPGQSLWRVPITHFSAWDCNWGFWPPPDARTPNLPPPKSYQPPSPPCVQRPSSTVDCESQVLGESLPVTGTPFHLTYRSDRVPGHETGRRLEIPLSGASVPGSLAGIDLSIEVAGQRIAERRDPAPGQARTFVWDGKDAYGREVQGSPRVSVTVAYAYRGYYAPVPRFGYNGAGAPIAGDRGRQETYFSETHTAAVHRWDARGQGLGAWTLDVHHAYDPIGKILHLGDGRRQSAESVQLVIESAAGGGRGGDGGPATQAELGSPYDVAVGPDGSVYIGDQDRIRKVSPNGTITTYVGRGGGCFPWTAPCGDGGPATQAQLNNATGLAVGPDGSLYFFANARLRRVGPDGIITTIAGTGVDGFSGDGGPAVEARITGGGIAVAPDGTLYFADSGSNRIRRIGTDGIITTVAGSGTRGSGGDGGPALDAQMYGPSDVALGPDGSLYIADTQGGHRQRVRKVSPAGIITTIAGPGCCQNSASHVPFHGDGGPATGARLDGLASLAFGPDGALYLMQGGYRPFVRRIGPDGIITTVAGLLIEASHTQGLAGDGGPATLARFSGANSLAVGPDGTVWVSDGMFWDGSRAVYNKRLRRISPYLPGFSATDLLIPSEDGSELYVFDADGRHLRTISTLTRAVRYRFDYDAAGRLAAVIDGDGNTTRIERDNAGRPVALVAPWGHRTALELDAEGYLARITNPAGAPFAMAYAAGGLLAAVTDPRGNTSRYEYDAVGRLAAAVDRAGQRQTWARSDPTATSYVVTRTDPTGAATRYVVERLATGDRTRTNTFPDGTVSRLGLDTTASRSAALPDGTSVSVAGDPDPRFGMQAPLAKTTVATPGGVSTSVASSRSVTLSLPGDPLSLTGLTETVSRNGRSYTRSYTGSTRTLTHTTPAGRRSTEVLDAQGRILTAQVAGLHPEVAAWDAQGRLTSLSRGTGEETRTTTFGYDESGNLATVTDALGRTVRLAYDAAGRLIRQTLPDGRDVVFSYDAAGNLSSLTTAGGAVHRFEHSPLDLLTEYQPPEVSAGSGATLYGYDVAGRLSRITRPDGEVLELSYDSSGRMSALTAPDGTTSYSYDPRTGNPASAVTSGGVSLSYLYDGSLPAGTVWSGALAGRVDRSFTPELRIKSSSVNGGSAIAYQYDADGLLTRAGDLVLNRSNENGRLLTTQLGAVTDTRTYNAFGELTGYSAAVNAAPVYAYELRRDKLGRIIEKTETLGGATDLYTYTYDGTGRLTGVTRNGSPAAAWTYDANGNRLTATTSAGLVSGTYDAQDRLTSYGSTSYSYSASGERTRRAAEGTTEYDYDALGNLLAVLLPDGKRLEYIVDGESRRVGRKIDGTLVQGFLWDNKLNVAAELDGSGNIVSRFVYASRPNVPDLLIKSGKTFRILSDHLGSPRLVVDVATGEAVQRLDYDAFGQVTLDTNPGFQPFGFAGGLYDRDTGLLRFGARDYDPETGTWTAKDPARFEGADSNLYAYVMSDPVNQIDLLGTDGWVTDAITAYDAWAIEQMELGNPKTAWSLFVLSVSLQTIMQLGPASYALTLLDTHTDPCATWVTKLGAMVSVPPVIKKSTALRYIMSTAPSHLDAVGRNLAAIDLVQRTKRLPLYHSIAGVVQLLDEALNP